MALPLEFSAQMHMGMRQFIDITNCEANMNNIHA